MNIQVFPQVQRDNPIDHSIVKDSDIVPAKNFLFPSCPHCTENSGV